MMTSVLVAFLALLELSSAFVVQRSGSQIAGGGAAARFFRDGSSAGAFAYSSRRTSFERVKPLKQYKVQSFPTGEMTGGVQVAPPSSAAQETKGGGAEAKQAVAEVLLETLEKRLKHGANSLTLEETNRVLEASDVLLEHLQQAEDVEQAQESPAASVNEASAGAIPAAVAASAGTTPPPTTPVTSSSTTAKAAQDTASQAPAPDFSLPQELLAAAVAQTTSKEDYAAQEALLEAVGSMDAATVTTMIQSGIQMTPETTDTAFWAVVDAVDTAEAKDEALPASVPIMLHHIFDADLRHLLTREQIRTNVTCMMPSTKGLSKSGLAYVFDDSAAKDLELTEGRRCEGGTCCPECSRNIFPTFASEDETDMNTYPELGSITFNDLEKVSAKTILQFTRLIERVRRTIAHEYGLPLKTILPLQAYSRKYVAGTTQQGGGGGEGDFVTLHTDEATHDGYHYSCVLYLSTAGKDFEGGDFVFNDPADPEELEALKKEVEEKNKEANKVDENLLDMLKKGELPDDLVIGSPDEHDEETHYAALEEEIRKSGRKLTPYSPTKGAAVIFSSGWENMHEVEKITSGIRYAVPCFFTTCPVPDMAYQQMNVGKPGNEEDIADDWLHLLLAHRQESPIESVGRVKELLMKWHYMCTPLSEH